MRRTFPLLVTPVLLLSACTAAPAVPASGGPVAVATTTHLGSILGDITTCAGSTSETLMKPGDDPHTFAVSSDQIARLARAKLVVANGLGLEGGLGKTLASVATDGGHVLEVAPQVAPLTYEAIAAKQAASGHAADHDHEHADGHADGHDHGAYDPHVHMDAARMAKAATVIGDALAERTQDHAYATCGQQVSDKLKAADAEVRATLATIPAERRVLVTDHEAYNYFADAYGFEVVGVVVPGGSTDAEPSSGAIAALVKAIRDEHVPAIFSNNTVNPKLVEAVAREAGTSVRVVALYEGSLGPKGSGADTYAGMMTTNAKLVADALK